MRICCALLALVPAAGAQQARLASGDILGFTAQGAWRMATISGKALPLAPGTPVVTVCDVERGAQYHPLLGVAHEVEGTVNFTLDSKELALKASLVVVSDGTAFKCKLRVFDTTGKDRGLLVRVGVPVDALGWKWWDDLEQSRVIATNQLYEDVKPLRAFAALPEWKDKPDLRMGFNSPNFCAVVSGPTALCLAVPLDQPRLCRTGYDARQRLFSITYDVALCTDTAPPLEAGFEFEWFACDPVWGMRSALDRYYQRHGRFFAKHVKSEGMWLAFTPLDAMDNATEFGIATQEGAESVGYDDQLGVQSFSYYTHAGIYADVPNHRRGVDPTPSLERRIAAVEANLKRGTGRDGLYAECGLHDATGRLAAEPGTVYGDVLAQFCLEPELDYGKWLLDRIDRFFAGYRKRGELDGFYYDGLTTGINYRREHFRHAAYPPSWDPVRKQPYLYNYFSSVEWARLVADKLHGLGKLTMMNGAMGANPFCAPYLDIMGAETGLNISRADFNFVRMICRHKTFATLLKGNYAKLGGAEIELFMKRCLAYGVFPGFFDWPPSGLGPGGRYWDHPEYFERDRHLFRKYQPLVKAIAAAGWEPLTFARARDARFQVGRFGTMEQGRVFFTVLNDSAEAVQDSLSVPLGALRLPHQDLVAFDEIAGRKLAATTETDHLIVPLSLPAQSVALVHLARTNEFLAFHRDAAARLFDLEDLQQKADAGRAERPTYWHVTEGRCFRDGGALRLRNDQEAQAASASQWVMLFQPQSRPITVRARVKTRDLTGGTNQAFALRAVVCCVDNQFTTRDPRILPLEPGNGDWRTVEWTLESSRPVRSVQLLLQLNRRRGSAWFDDVSVRSADAPDTERVIDGGFDAWYERLSPEQAARLAPKMAAVRNALANARAPSIPQWTGALAAAQGASMAITDHHLENPARRELRDLQDASTHLAIACQTLAGIDALELLTEETVVPGETLQATVRLIRPPGSGQRTRLALHAEGGWKITPQAITGTEGTFQVFVPAESKPGARHPLRAEALVTLSEECLLPLRAARTITLVAPFAAAGSLAGVESEDGTQVVALRLTNNLARVQTFSVAVNAPAGWTWRNRQTYLQVVAHSAVAVPLNLVPNNQAKAGRQKVGVSIRGGDREETFFVEMTHVPGSANRLANAGFESGGNAALNPWQPWQGGYTADARIKRSGAQCVRLHADSAGAPVGATQSITLNQTRVAPLIVRGWCRAENLSGGGDGCCLYVDVYYTDGTKLYGQKVLFAPGTHDWQFGETRIPTTRPVRSVSVYTMLRGSAGTAWFDDLFLAEELMPQPHPK